MSDFLAPPGWLTATGRDTALTWRARIVRAFRRHVLAPMAIEYFALRRTLHAAPRRPAPVASTISHTPPHPTLEEIEQVIERFQTQADCQAPDCVVLKLSRDNQKRQRHEMALAIARLYPANLTAMEQGMVDEFQRRVNRVVEGWEDPSL